MRNLLFVLAAAGCTVQSRKVAYVVDTAAVVLGTYYAGTPAPPCSGGDDMCPNREMQSMSRLVFGGALAIAGMTALVYTYSHAGTGESEEAPLVVTRRAYTIDTSGIRDPHRARVLRQTITLASDGQCEAVRELLAREDSAWVQHDVAPLPQVAPCMTP